MAQRVVIVGGGVGGAATALALADGGHRVTLIERDDLGPLADPEAAFTAECPGAPQVHHTHAFLARLAVVLRDRFPDVLDALMAAGGTTLPASADLGDPRPGDEDLAVLVVRRTTLEWVLRRAVASRPAIDVRTGVGVTGLVAVPGDAADEESATGPTGAAAGVGGAGVPVVTGVRLHDGTVLDADVVVAANGRRSDVPAWLAPFGVEVPETVHESGLMYLSRWYRPPAGHDLVLDFRLGDLGFVKYLGVPGDGGTLSVTLAIRVADAELRAHLADPDVFDRACHLLPGPDRFFAHGPLEPLGPVLPMGGLLNRLRRFVAGTGEPTVAGFHAVGDAHTCTNPLYGRGCSLAVVQAVELADALAANPDDPIARARRYEQASTREVEPWFDVAVQMDALGSDRGPEDGDGRPGGSGAGSSKALVALRVAAATDPVIARALVRFWNVLATPADLMADPEFLARAAAVMADADAHPAPPRSGPSRTELLASLAPPDRSAPACPTPTAPPTPHSCGRAR
ncbi:MAG TPA: NAD(P)-binding protein [Acidimicrobiales bacterium]|nr:NAD(P)-binding protein [Acidimicrobiales bacterium]